ncbi:rhodanese-like domain-containing protein [Bogoriella caseilytica]|uniref:Rhodanese-related sulfurtransferase n=1 Tax=Bogoriella caseilytica TaxID=56055 RepID=A0A3N2BCZ8_9MICO|nr:rhodanese-like domain-containing protein [Bogoriella caseilytica]ROR73108.1 rhodanese-related sulfurtransferase [Bogoriella caseilytica]
MAFSATPGSDLPVTDLDTAQPVPNGYALLDVREQDEWDAGHAPGAIHIPMGELPTRIEELPEQDLLVVCRAGGRSARSVQWLTANGYDAYNIDGGMKGWAQAGLPLEREDGEEPEII